MLKGRSWCRAYYNYIFISPCDFTRWVLDCLVANHIQLGPALLLELHYQYQGNAWNP